MNTLNTQPNFHTPGQVPLRAHTPGDDFYEQLIHTHRGHSDDQSRLVNARLILLLANHIGDLTVLKQALAVAAALPPLPAGEGRGEGAAAPTHTPSPQPAPASGSGGQESAP